MKRLLPFIFSLVLTAFMFAVVFTQAANAQVTQEQLTTTDDQWIIDDEVTAIGKNASRSGLLLDWALKDYNWSYTSPGSTNPLLPFWATLRNTVYAMLVAVVIIAAIVMLVTRGRNLTVRRFIPRFILIVVLVTLSFSLVQVLYEIVDVIQGFFVRPGGVPISQKDLLSIGWNYNPFIGLRLLGDQNYESAFTTLLFVKLTTFTYYVMLGILLVRKVILWFFIIISPLFPLLLFFYPLRNTAKIWLGEFFRWLLYAPLFAIFLAGVVSLWKLGIPLSFNFGGVNDASNIVFPTAVSILLGGPGQAVGQLNNLNIIDTYAQYIVALMMLWGVIIVPWILLQIFLDYLSDINMNSNPMLRQMASVINKLPLTPPGTPPPPPGGAGSGRARSIPLIKDFSIPTTANLAKPIPTGAVNVQSMTKISVPTLRDIARIESQSITNSQKTRDEADRVRKTLTKIANPAQLPLQVDRTEYEKIRQSLQNESLKGDKYASHILQTAQNYISSQTETERRDISSVIRELQNPQIVVNEKEREKITTIKERIEKETLTGNPLATRLSQSLTPVIDDTHLTQALSKLVTPSKDVDTFERAEQFKQKLEHESQEGSSLASLILATVSSLASREKVSNSLVQILQPSTVSNLSQRTRFEQISKSIEDERQQGNEFATTLKVRLESLQKETDSVEKEKIVTQIRESVLKEKEGGNPLAALILAHIQELAEEKADKHMTELGKQLREAQKEGNPLANELLLLSQKESLTEEEIAEIEKKIEEAKRNGDPLGVLLSELLANKRNDMGTEVPASLPKTNRIQQVSLDDYEAVKKMWNENYENLEVPGNISRKAWIQDDIKQISETIDLLSSENAENVQMGMEKVSDILPFLLVGGFSQSEIAAYLKAKLEAAKGVLGQLDKDSTDTEVVIQRKKVVTPKHLSQAVEADLTPSFSPSKEPTITFPVETHGNPVETNEAIIRMANLSIPSLKNIAQYEKMQLEDEKNQHPDIKLLHDTFGGIADPLGATDQTKKQYYQEIRNKLIAEQHQGNILAGSLLVGSQIASAGTLHDEITKYVALSTLLSLLATETESDDYKALMKKISYASANGNDFAKQLERMITNPASLSDGLQKLSLVHDIISQEKVSDPLAIELLQRAEKITVTKESTPLIESARLLQVLSDTSHLPKGTKKQVEEMKQEILSSTDKTLLQLKDIIEKVSEKGIDLSSVIQTASLIQNLSGGLEKHTTDSSLFPLLVDKTMQASLDGSIAASLFVYLLLLQTRVNQETDRFHRLILSLADPSHVTNGSKQAVLELRTLVQSESKKGNVLALNITDIVNQAIKKEVSSTSDGLKALWEEVLSQKQKGDQLAAAIVDEVTKQNESQKLFDIGEVLKALSSPETIPQSEKGYFQSLHKTLEDKAQTGDPSAMSILSAVEVVKKHGASVSEAKKVDDILQKMENTSYIQGFNMLVSTTLLSQTSLNILRDMLVKVAKNDPRVEDVRDILNATKNTVLWEALSDAIKEVSTGSDPQKIEKALLQARSVLFVEETKGNKTAQRLVSKITSWRDVVRQDIFIKLLEKMSRPESIQLPSEKTAVEKLKIELQTGPRTDISKILEGIVLQLSKSNGKDVTKLVTDYIKKEAESGNTLSQDIVRRSGGSLSGDQILSEINKEAITGNPVASAIQELIKKQPEVVLPESNTLQKVSIEDYEAVKRMWLEGYKSLDVPGMNRTRKEWLDKEVKSIDETISLLTSQNENDQEEGTRRVSHILPFLLIGGFSNTEVVSYLKAKGEAAREVLGQLSAIREESDTSSPVTHSNDSVKTLQTDASE